MADFWKHTIITLVVIPFVLGVFWYLVNGKDKAIKESLDLWHKAVEDKFTEVLNKLEIVPKHENRLIEIETTHRLKGCNQPYDGVERRGKK